MKSAFSTVAFLAVILSGQPASKGFGDDKTIWLDAPVKKQWDHAGRPVPHVPRGAGVDAECMKYRHRAETGEERMVEKAGWFLMDKATVHNGIVVVTGQASNAGMCRSAQYQEFAFVDGAFAGTLSPVLMNARSDGSTANVSVPGDGRIVADFSRYSERDPLCCPSRISTVEYEIIRADGKPLVVLKSIRTHRTN